MKKNRVFGMLMMILSISSILFTSCADSPNTVGDPHFDDNGCLLRDTLNSNIFKPINPSRINFFVEVSGSMNGFFRANVPTKFKSDVWTILSYYTITSDSINIITNGGNQGARIPISSFQTHMNAGSFVSSASTKVPQMIESIINNTNFEEGEIAVLISDMIYSPVGSVAPNVLLTQYSTDISTIFAKYGKAVSLVGATSNFIGSNGNIYKESPYYFLIIGNPRNVAAIRNGISTLLYNSESLIDNIDSGFDYGAPTYNFGIPDNCFQMVNEPTFLGYDTQENDTCTIKLKVNLENYRWIIANKKTFLKAFKYKTLYGSEVKLGDTKIYVQNITNKELVRTAYATIELKIFNMPMESDVIEWTLQLPDTDISEFVKYLGAQDQNQRDKTYSLENFIKGMFYGGVVNQSLKSNYILISKKS